VQAVPAPPGRQRLEGWAAGQHDRDHPVASMAPRCWRGLEPSWPVAPASGGTGFPPGCATQGQAKHQPGPRASTGRAAGRRPPCCARWPGPAARGPRPARQRGLLPAPQPPPARHPPCRGLQTGGSASQRQRAWSSPPITAARPPGPAAYHYYDARGSRPDDARSPQQLPRPPDGRRRGRSPHLPGRITASLPRSPADAEQGNLRFPGI